MWASCGLAGVIAALEPNLIRTVIRSQGTRNVKFVLGAQNTHLGRWSIVALLL